MSLVRTFVWAHWRQQLHALRGGRRSGFSRASAWIHVVVQVLVAILFLLLAAGFVGLGLLGGQALASQGENREVALGICRILLGFLTFLALLLPLIRASYGSLQGTGRLLLLPISRRRLHALESVTHLSDPWLLIVLPALVALAIPVLAASPLGGIVVLLGAVAFFLVLGTLATALTFGARLLLRDRKRAETAAFVFFLVLILLSFLPALFDSRSPERTGADRAPQRSEAARETGTGAAAFAGSDHFPWPLQLLPSEAFSRIAARSSAGAPPSALASLLPLGLVGTVSWLASWALWRRLVGSPETGSRRRAIRELPRLRPWAGLRPGTAAVAISFVRTVFRTVQGKIVLVMPTLVVVVLSVLGEAESGPWKSLFGGASLVLAAAFFAVSGLQNMLLNLYGMDGAGLTLQLLQPLSGREIVRGKAAGGGFVLASLLTPALVAAMFLGQGISPGVALGGLLAGLAAYLLFFPVGAWVSTLFPKAVDLSKMGSEGKPHGAAILIGLLSLLLVMILPGGVGFVGFVLGGSVGAVGTEALLCILSAVLFVVFTNSAAGVFELRREGIHLAIREG